MFRTKIKKILLYISATISATGVIAAMPTANAAPDIGRHDPGVQLDKARETMERERVARQIADDEEARKNKIERQDAATADEAQGQVTFELKKVEISA